MIGNNKLSHKSKFKKAISISVILIIVIISLFMYGVNISGALEHSISETLTDVIFQQNHVVKDNVKNILVNLDGVSGAVKVMNARSSEYDNSQKLQDILNALAISSGYKNIIVSDAQGNSIQADGSRVDISQMNYFHQSMAGVPITSEIITFPNSMEEALLISVPIIENNSVTGVVAAELPIEMMEDILLPSFGGEGITTLLDSTGNVIATTSNNSDMITGQNVYEQVSVRDNDSKIAVSQLSQIVHNGDFEDSSLYTIDGVSRRFKYVFMEEMQWALLVSVPESVVSVDANTVFINTGLLLTEILIIIVLLWVRILFLRKKSLKELSRVAYYDDLTKLKNEKKFKMDVKKILEERPTEQFSVIKMDIVDFSIINKLHDFETGNKVLKAVAELEGMVKSMMKDENFVCARLVADEFMLFGRYDKLYTIGLGRKVFENAINDKVSNICSRKLKFRFSRYKIPLGTQDIDEIVDMVTLAHNASKKTTKDVVYDYDDNLKEQLVKKTIIIDTMHDALKNKEFKVYLQPKNCLTTGEVCGAEALVRWQKADGTLVFPGDFIPIFEQEGFIVELDKYMLKEVCKIISRFAKKGLKQIPISVNFSRLHILNDNFVNEITKIVDSVGVPRHLVEIEMTETSLIENESEIKSKFEQLHDCGFTLSMDDFGAGYSSLDLLSDLSFDVLKLDKSLLAKSDDSEKKRYVISTILDMSKGLSIKTVCEGVETLDQVEFLRNAGCDIAQGYYYSRPIPNQEFDSFLITEKKAPIEMNRLQYVHAANM